VSAIKPSSESVSIHGGFPGLDVIPGAGTVIGYDDQQAVAAAARFEQRKQLHQ
jgi:hypothetical protein